MLEDYLNSVKERDSQGILPLPLDAEQTSGLIELIKDASKNDKNLLELLTERVPAGVDDAAYVKAAFLSDIANKKISCELISPKEATFYLGTMLGGYNVEPLISLIDDPECIGNMKSNGEPTPDKKSLLYSYIKLLKTDF